MLEYWNKGPTWTHAATPLYSYGIQNLFLSCLLMTPEEEVRDCCHSVSLHTAHVYVPYQSHSGLGKYILSCLLMTPEEESHSGLVHNRLWAPCRHASKPSL